MGGPCGTGYENTVGNGSGESGVDVFRTSRFDFRPDRRVGIDPFAPDHICGGQKLGTVADRRDRFPRIHKCTDELQNFAVQAQMFGRASSGQNECIESIRGNILEIRIQREVVPAFSV